MRAYRACTTAAEERALVKKESAHIRDLFREGDKAFRRQNIAKLLFFHMNGYPTSFGMTECIKLCASPKFSDKRVAYLGLMILVDETAEILMLMTNCLKQDLLCREPYIIALALTVLGDIASTDMVRDLLPEIEKHFTSQDPLIRKKALLAAVRAARKLEREELADCVAVLPRALDTGAPAVHVAGAAFVIEYAKRHPDGIPALRDVVFNSLIQSLRELLLSAPKARAHDTTISGVRNPFLTVKNLHALRMITGPGSPAQNVAALSDIVAQVAANTSPSHVIGCAVLYECVRVATAIDADGHLQTLAVSVLGNFLAHKLATIRYVALQELVKVTAFLEGGQNVAAYRDTIIGCLGEPDTTVSQMAVELVYSIANESNVEEMTSHLLKYLDETRPQHHIEDTCYKLFDMMERFGRNVQFKVDTFVSALEKVDLIMPENLITSFAALISCDVEAASHAIRALFRVSLEPLRAGTVAVDQFEVSQVSEGTGDSTPVSEGAVKKGIKTRRKPRLERLALYVLGEYGDLIIDQSAGFEMHKVIDTIDCALQASPVSAESWIVNTSPEFAAEITRIRETALGALAKLAARVQSSGSTGQTSGLGGLNGKSTDPLALLAPPPKAPTQKLGGLGGDLLAGLGVSDSAISSTSSALVPQSSTFVPSVFDSDGLLGGGETGSGDVLLRIRSIIAKHRKSRDLETQQRACEYSNLLTADLAHIRVGALSRMPPIDYNAIKERAERRRKQLAASRSGQSGQAAFSTDLLSLLDDSIGPQSGVPALPAGSELLAIAGGPSQTPTANIMGGDLNSLLGLTSAPAPQAAPAAKKPGGGGIGLDELLG